MFKSKSSYTNRDYVNLDSLLSFNGSTQYAKASRNSEIKDYVDANKTFSISWIGMLNELSEDDDYVCSMASNFSENSANGWVINYEHYEGGYWPRLRLTSDLSNSSSTIDSNQPNNFKCEIGRLYHFVFTYTPDDLRLYVNDVRIDITPTYNSIGSAYSNGYHDLLFGLKRNIGNISTPGIFSKQKIGQFMVFEKIITPAEVSALFQQGGFIPETAHQACVTYYPMNQFSGRIIFNQIKQFNSERNSFQINNVIPTTSTDLEKNSIVQQDDYVQFTRVNSSSTSADGRFSITGIQSYSGGQTEVILDFEVIEGSFDTTFFGTGMSPRSYDTFNASDGRMKIRIVGSTSTINGNVSFQFQTGVNSASIGNSMRIYSVSTGRYPMKLKPSVAELVGFTDAQITSISQDAFLSTYDLFPVRKFQQKFDGISQIADAGLQENIRSVAVDTENFTFVMECKLLDGQSMGVTFESRFGSIERGFRFTLSKSDGQVTGFIRFDGAINNSKTWSIESTNVLQNQSTTLVITHEAKYQFKAYIDGVERNVTETGGFGDLTNGMYDENSVFQIGGSTEYSNYYNGIFSTCIFFNRILSSKEITTLNENRNIPQKNLHRYIHAHYLPNNNSEVINDVVENYNYAKSVNLTAFDAQMSGFAKREGLVASNSVVSPKLVGLRLTSENQYVAASKNAIPYASRGYFHVSFIIQDLSIRTDIFSISSPLNEQNYLTLKWDGNLAFEIKYAEGETATAVVQRGNQDAQLEAGKLYSVSMVLDDGNLTIFVNGLRMQLDITMPGSSFPWLSDMDTFNSYDDWGFDNPDVLINRFASGSTTHQGDMTVFDFHLDSIVPTQKEIIEWYNNGLLKPPSFKPFYSIDFNSILETKISDANKEFTAGNNWTTGTYNTISEGKWIHDHTAGTGTSGYNGITSLEVSRLDQFIGQYNFYNQNQRGPEFHFSINVVTFNKEAGTNPILEVRANDSSSFNITDVGTYQFRLKSNKSANFNNDINLRVRNTGGYIEVESMDAYFYRLQNQGRNSQDAYLYGIESGTSDESQRGIENVSKGNRYPPYYPAYYPELDE